MRSEVALRARLKVVPSLPIFIPSQHKSAIPIVPGQRHSALAVPRLDQKRLVQVQLARLEVVGGAGQIQPPNPILEFADKAAGLVCICLEPTKPLAERQEVMLTQIFHVADLEADFLSALQHGCDWHQIIVRKDVYVGKSWLCGLGSASGAAYAVIHENSAGFQQAKCGAKIF